MELLMRFIDFDENGVIFQEMMMHTHKTITNQHSTLINYINIKYLNE
jgi:hypothetical protein